MISVVSNKSVVARIVLPVIALTAVVYNPAMSEEVKMKTTTIRLPEPLWRRVRAAAGLQGQSANEWINQLIRQAIENAPEAESGRKGGVYAPNLHTASTFADR
jgi:hypothetical protein